MATDGGCLFTAAKDSRGSLIRPNSITAAGRTFKTILCEPASRSAAEVDTDHARRSGTFKMIPLSDSRHDRDFSSIVHSMSADDHEKFINSLPRLKGDSVLIFRCHPDIPCFNRCCGDLNLALSPCDVMRLRVALGIKSTTFLKRFATVSPLQGNGFPSVMLNMKNDENQSCPFVEEKGCSVYAHRPGACRVYPIGRGASMDKDGNLTEEYLLVKESHCMGFWEDVEPMTVTAYLNSQGMAPYIELDNRYIQVMHRWNGGGRALDNSLFARVFAAAYRPDELAVFVKQPALMSHIVQEGDDRLSYETARLAFGFDWIETVLFENRR
jgi:Fe-S-cluster containining protein